MISWIQCFTIHKFNINLLYFLFISYLFLSNFFLLMRDSHLRIYICKIVAYISLESNFSNNLHYFHPKQFLWSSQNFSSSTQFDRSFLRRKAANISKRIDFQYHVKDTKNIDFSFSIHMIETLYCVFVLNQTDNV